MNITESNIYDLLFQFSWMKSGNISEKKLTFDVKDDFHVMITQLMQLSSEEKILKEKIIAQNK